MSWLEELINLLINHRLYNEDPIAKLSDQIRHLYDICQILKHDEYRNFVAGEDFKPLCDLCIEDEKAGFFAHLDCFEHPLVAQSNVINLALTALLSVPITLFLPSPAPLVQIPRN